MLSGKCFTRDYALDTGNREMFLQYWYATYAPGWGTAEEDFLAWLISSGRLGSSPFWTGIDGRIIGDMWDAAALWQSGARATSSAILENWLQFMGKPSVDGFWKAHNTTLFAAVNSEQGRVWFAEESRAEQVFINDALVDIRDATTVTAAASDGADLAPTSPVEHALLHACDPSTHCVGAYLAAVYPTQYPVPFSWFTGKFGAADTLYACARPVMAVSC